MSPDTAVVLAAGEGTRLRPLTAHRPKPMLPAATRPILDSVLDALVAAGITDLHAVVGYERDRVQNHVGAAHRGVPVHYHRQVKRMGSGHALLRAADAVAGETLVVNGDEVLAPELVAAVRDAHDRESARVTIAVVESEDAPRYGAVRLADDRVTDLVERPADDGYRFLNAGVYAVDERTVEAVQATPRRAGELWLTDAVADLAAAEEVRGVRTDTPLVTARYPWDLLAVADHLLETGDVPEPERSPGVYVAETATVADRATLRPPVAVAAHGEVGTGATVGPHAVVGRATTVAPGAVVARSVLDGESRVGPNATLVDAVVGQSVRVGAGVVVPGGPADVRVGTTVHEDERLGAVLADRVTVGGGATLAPGTLVGPDATVQAGATVAGRVAEGAEVVR